jgi:hypothetical protein
LYGRQRIFYRSPLTYTTIMDHDIYLPGRSGSNPRHSEAI